MTIDGGPRCGSCAHWMIPSPDPANLRHQPNGSSECRALPPVPIPGQMTRLWPTTYAFDYCGLWTGEPGDA